MSCWKLQLIVNNIKLADLNGFKFSTSNIVVHLCRIQVLYPDPYVYPKGQRIPYVEETKFLFVFFSPI